MRDLRSQAEHAMVGDSAAMGQVRELITIAAPTLLPVLIEGETGVGKELVARALHIESQRSGRFVSVNVCAIADTMFEDAFFGHARGAFTGAFTSRSGYLSEADRGTIFLDEIGGIARPAQAKLLRALETLEFRPVGATTDQRSSFRVVAASNEPVASLVEQGCFRPDLAFRLQGVVIRVPPLRDRREDIGPLAEYFAALTPPDARGPIRLTTEVIRLLGDSDWMGNVRELRQVISRAIAFAETGQIGLLEMERAWQCGRGGTGTSMDGHVRQRDEDFSGRRLVEVLERHCWDTVAAADELEVTRKTIYARLQRLGIEIPGRYQRRRACAADAPPRGDGKIHKIHRESAQIHRESGESVQQTTREALQP